MRSPPSRELDFNFLNADEGERLPRRREGQPMEESAGTGRRNEGEIYVEIGGGRARGMQNRGANLAPHQRRNGNERSRAVSAFLGRPAARPTTSFSAPPRLSTSAKREKSERVRDVGELSN